MIRRGIIIPAFDEVMAPNERVEKDSAGEAAHEDQGGKGDPLF
ncbi:MAG: hypothetical protein WA974_01180 [Thermodesulfobacteriota bacterium]